MSCRPLDRCVVCHSAHLTPYLDLGDQPLANSYHTGQKLPRYPLAAQVCESCWHSQLTVSVDPVEMFDHYLYVSDTSKTLDQYFDWLADLVVSRKPVDTPSVLELACNSGLLLEKFHRKGFPCVGVDPAKNLRPLAKARGLLTLTEYWNTETALKLTGEWDALPEAERAGLERSPHFASWGAEGRKYDLILAMHVLPHVPDPREFLMACRISLAPGGRIWVQTSQCDMFRNGEYDVFYHEHVSHFTAHSFARLAEGCGLRVTHALKTPIHGASFLFELGAADGHCPAFTDMLRKERELGMTRPKFYREFAAQAREGATALADCLTGFRDQGFRLVGYGAAAKGSTVLNFIGQKLDYIIDDNPLKHDHLTPGLDIPIRGVEALSAEAGDLVIVPLAWNFYSEIKGRAAKYLRTPARFVKYFPALSVETVWGDAEGEHD
jgi:2-polyprenyl-3-methyl-5-hydroxy-6-metoxy-1,4-benzoquinol methylase